MGRIFKFFILKINIICGGWLGSSTTILSSCDENVFGSRTWTRVGNMLILVTRFSMVTINNRVFMIGGRDRDNNDSDKVYELNTEAGQWRWGQPGFLGLERNAHAVSVIPIDNIWQYCTKTFHGEVPIPSP